MAMNVVVRSTRSGRAKLLLGSLLVLLIGLSLSIRAVHADPPAEHCASLADRDKVEPDPVTGVLYECRCRVAMPYGYVCAWIQIEDDAVKSNANGYFTSAELGYGGNEYGVLRARSSAVGQWENYTLGGVPGSPYWALTAGANGQYVSAELGYSGGYYGMLRGRADLIGDWEQFNLYRITTGGTTSWALQSAANGLYVSTELGYGGGDYGMLRARSGAIGAWEQYSLFRQWGSGITAAAMNGSQNLSIPTHSCGQGPQPEMTRICPGN
jgi:hypothetical protein